MTRIKEQSIRCLCGHDFSASLYESVNTQLSPEQVKEFLEAKLNRPECPSCGKQLWVLLPVLFNDMEREFMVYIGSQDEVDGYVKQRDGAPSIIYVRNYVAGMAAMLIFRQQPENATVAYDDMNPERAFRYVQAYLRKYKELNSECDRTN